jgi:NADPH:quinone reductase-like Zn-dependent oxidoreductase
MSVRLQPGIAFTLIPEWRSPSMEYAYDALVIRMSLKEGETLLVLGAAGNSGVAAIQLGKALGAQVIAVASTQEMVLLRRFGGKMSCSNRGLVCE